MLAADGAVEGVDRVLVHAPAGAVRRGAVVAALAAALRHPEPALQPAVVLLRRDQLRRTRGVREGGGSSPASLTLNSG